MKPSFDDSPGLSPDLEWMLGSRQAPPGMLAEALVEEYYLPLYRLVFSILDDEGAAERAARQAFTSALSSASSYRSGQDIRSWLFRMALDACQKPDLRFISRQGPRAFLARLFRVYRFGSSIPRSDVEVVLWRAFDALPGQERLAALLFFGHGWTAPGIARLLGRTENEVLKWIGSSRDRFADALTYLPGPPEVHDRASLDALLSSSLGARWPAPRLPAGELQRIARSIAAELGRQAVPRRRAISFGETTWVLVIAVLAVGLVWGSGRLAGSPEPTSPPKQPASQAGRAKTAAVQAPGAGSTAARRALASPPSGTPSATPSAPSPTRPVVLAYFPQPGETLRDIAAKMGIPVEELASLNRLAEDPDLQVDKVLEIPIQPPPEALYAPTPVVTAAPLLPPLTASASSGEIYRFLLLSERLWSTLWISARQVFYGPPGYVGPPQAARLQAWVSQPGQSRELVGPPAGWPRYDTLISGGRIVYRDLSRPQDPFSTGSVDVATGPVQSLQLRSLIFPGRSDWIQRPGSFQGIREETAAGRPAVVVDWRDGQGRRSLRLWVDATTGVILRQQSFAGGEGKTLVSELLVTSAAFNIDFPSSLFDPRRGWVGGFAVDPHGRPEGANEPFIDPVWTPAPGHEPLPYTPAPAGFDPSGSPLTFQLPPNTLSAHPEDGGQGVDLFAGRYFLGSLDIGHPLNALCARSPDGQWIAYISQGSWMDFDSSLAGHDLVWFNLKQVSNVHQPSLDISQTDFAFSPDSRRLAVSGYYQHGDGSAVFVVDLQSGESQPVLNLKGYVGSLMWSPDGRSLALLGSRADPQKLEALVVQVTGGRVIYSVPVNINILRDGAPDASAGRIWPSPYWPARSWGEQFPIFTRDLETCTRPPAVK